MGDETNLDFLLPTGVQQGKVHVDVPSDPEESHYLKRSEWPQLGVSRIKLVPDSSVIIFNMFKLSLQNDRDIENTEISFREK